MNETKLTIFIDEDEQKELFELKVELGDDFGSDRQMYDFLEPLVCNSELDWVSPEITGDLTDAPMLAIFGDDEPGNASDGSGYRPTGFDGKTNIRQPVLFRWAFMDYQVKSMLDELLHHRQVTLIGGN